MRETIDIVIYVSGGNVQDVATNLADPDRTVRVTLVDYDNAEDVDPDNAPDDCMIVEGDLAVVTPTCLTSDPAAVALVINHNRAETIDETEARLDAEMANVPGPGVDPL